MEVIRSVDACPSPAAGCAVTIGAYDGVHLGHRAVIASVKNLAADRGLETAVVTFDRHPASVVRPDSAPKLLTDLDQKLELLADVGVDHALVVTFDERQALEPADAFVERVLVQCLRARAVVVGEDFHFGHRRQGNVELLRRIGAVEGFDVTGLQLVDAAGQPAENGGRVSSTAVRSLLADGDIEAANAMLGRHHEVRGLVVKGDQRGRELGFPTANVNVPDDICLPADGIYAGWYERPGGDVHPVAISLGRRPTFYDDQPYSLLEAHLLDVEVDLYDEPARVRFEQRLRGQQRFDGIDQLVAQISRDCDQARTILGRKPAR